MPAMEVSGNTLLGRRQVVKTQDFDSCIRRFESSRPSQLCRTRDRADPTGIKPSEPI